MFVYINVMLYTSMLCSYNYINVLYTSVGWKSRNDGIRNSEFGIRNGWNIRIQFVLINK